MLAIYAGRLHEMHKLSQRKEIIGNFIWKSSMIDCQKVTMQKKGKEGHIIKEEYREKLYTTEKAEA